MKLLVVSQYYYPEQFRVNEICEELVRRGNEVTVISGIPNYPQGEIFVGYEKSFEKPDNHNGVKIIRCNNRPRYRGILNLLRNYMSFVSKANKIISNLEEEYDAIYVYQLSPVTMVLPAIRYKRKKSIPLFVYCCDLWPESVRELSDNRVLSRRNLIYLFSKFISRKIYGVADMIGVKCTQFIDYLEKECHVERKKVCLLYEHAEESYLSVSEVSKENDYYDFMFLGNIGYSQNCEELVSALARVAGKEKCRLHFVGDGSALERLRKHVKQMNLEELVVFHGRHPISEMESFYNIADCCLLTLSNKTACGLTPPAKLSGYMAAARPIIGVAEGATRDIIKAADCGICVEPGNLQELIDAMQYAIEHNTVFSEKGVSGREYFKEHFMLRQHVDELEKQLSRLIKKRKEKEGWV